MKRVVLKIAAVSATAVLTGIGVPTLASAANPANAFAYTGTTSFQHGTATNDADTETKITSAVWGQDRWITIKGWAQPGSRLKTTNDPNQGWFDPENGIVRANSDGSFTLQTRRLINGQAVVESFDGKRSESNHVTPQTHLQSAVRGQDGWITIKGWAQPGSRLKTTNDPNQGWFDPENGNVTYAGGDASFTLRTKRLINGQAAVKSFDVKTGKGISESNHLTPTTA